LYGTRRSKVPAGNPSAPALKKILEDEREVASIFWSDGQALKPGPDVARIVAYGEPCEHCDRFRDIIHIPWFAVVDHDGNVTARYAAHGLEGVTYA
jgi:hypothetical protein